MAIEQVSRKEAPVLFSHSRGHGHVSDIVAFCEVHELLALAKTGGVDVYRLNGQHVFTVTPPDDEDDGQEPSALAWKPDGSLLGVGWAGGACCLFSGEDGRLMGVHATSSAGAKDGKS